MRLMTGKDDIISSIIPEDEQDELPSGFTSVGHVGKFSLLPSRRFVDLGASASKSP